jgi:hypothetical protein
VEGEAGGGSALQAWGVIAAITMKTKNGP